MWRCLWIRKKTMHRTTDPFCGWCSSSETIFKGQVSDMVFKWGIPLVPFREKMAYDQYSFRRKRGAMKVL